MFEVLFLSASFCYQYQPQEIQGNKYHREYKGLLDAYSLSGHHHQTMIENTADASGFHRSDKKSCNVHICHLFSVNSR